MVVDMRWEVVPFDLPLSSKRIARTLGTGRVTGAAGPVLPASSLHLGDFRGTTPHVTVTFQSHPRHCWISPPAIAL